MKYKSEKAAKARYARLRYMPRYEISESILSHMQPKDREAQIRMMGNPPLSKMNPEERKEYFKELGDLATYCISKSPKSPFPGDNFVPPVGGIRVPRWIKDYVVARDAYSQVHYKKGLSKLGDVILRKNQDYLMLRNVTELFKKARDKERLLKLGDMFALRNYMRDARVCYRAAELSKEAVKRKIESLEDKIVRIPRRREDTLHFLSFRYHHVILFFVLSSLFFSAGFTGYSIANFPSHISNLLGAAFFVIGLILSYIYFKKRLK